MANGSESIRRFVGIALGVEAVPYETTILPFRHLLEEHQLTEQLFTLVRGLLEHRGLVVKSGTIVDATILNAPDSTENATGTRDPKMRQVRKGKEWYCRVRVHVRTDRRGVVHSLTTDAAANEVSQLPHLVRGEERALYGDRAYWSETDWQACESAGIRYRMNRRGTAFGGALGRAS